MKWRPINTAPSADERPRKIFLVIAIDAEIGFSGRLYITDPYAVWRDSRGEFVRWPHHFAPTHWCPIPDTSEVE